MIGIRKSAKSGPANRRRSSPKQRKRQHLLDVKVRSRKATQQMTRRIMSLLCKVLLFIGLVGGTCFGVREGLRRLFWENPEYRLSQINFTSDGALTRAQVLATAGLREGCNIFTVNLTNVRERIAALPQAEHVEIQRVLPNRITINILERKPIAWLTAKGDEDPSPQAGAYLIDRSGVLTQPNIELPEYLHLPVIFGLSTDNLSAGEPMRDYRIKAALDLIRLSQSAPIQNRFQIRGIDLSKSYGMVATDQARAHITFGFDRIEWQLDRLGLILERVDESKKELQTVNLMVQRNVPVTFVNDAPAPDPAETVGKPQPGQPAAKPAEAPASKPAAAAKPAPARTSKPAAEVRRAEAISQGNDTNQTTGNKVRERAPTPVKRAEPFFPQQQRTKTNEQG